MVLPRLLIDLQHRRHYLHGAHWHQIGSPVPLGVDFRGGTQIQVQFKQSPDENQIRQAMDAAGIKDARIQAIRNANQASSNDVLISLPEQTNEAALDTGREQIVNALQAHYNNPFEVRNVQVVGPTVGKQLEKQATLATLYSMLGMLIYLWFRFQLIYGVAAVVACFHDTLITVGAFALTNQEISLTVIAAILTLVGYSMNDTIVVFDRIRENLRMSRREALPDVVNRSINQTLSRTVLTSGLTFITVLVSIHLRRPGSQGFLVCARRRHSHWHVFVHRRGRTDAGRMAAVARGSGKRRCAARRQAAARVMNSQVIALFLWAGFASDTHFCYR